MVYMPSETSISPPSTLRFMSQIQSLDMVGNLGAPLNHAESSLGDGLRSGGSRNWDEGSGEEENELIST